MIDNEKFLIDMLHNVEELSELQKEIIKFARGNLRLRNMRKEINDVQIAIGNVQIWINKIDEAKTESDVPDFKKEGE